MPVPRRITPLCPKCKGYNTYDIIPEIPDQPEFQLRPDEFLHDTYSIGNAKYHCADCDHTWKKYEGEQPYKRIKVIHSYVGGFPGPNHHVRVDLADKRVDHHTEYLFLDGKQESDYTLLTDEDIDFYPHELYRCDFVNWAEEYDTVCLVMDGTHWRVRIEYDTHCEIKVGDNHFPPKWAKFCKTCSAMSGHEFK
ncbi:hypothetical protein [Bacillus sp. KH172YL63]|uniref:hypothetical protein n=1 Tax=Bacillus sp. KH172YL63 TaxID=2709784 RepID=UPI0013E4F1DB|nr:hypothetical protein [Bacillus sp. KH172YL63]BCB03801.1 hypothetical protein KH172YL63_19340 [Bacillus sp. KH172YL63]